MKKIAFLLLLVSTAAFADKAYHYQHNPGHGHWRHTHGHWEWVVPAVVGGVIVYEATRPRVDPLNSVELKMCSPWTEIQNPDGTITRTRTCNQ